MSLIPKISSDTKRNFSEVDILDSGTNPVVQKKRVRNDINLMQRESSDAVSDMDTATEGQLRRIASEAIGESWELIAPFLGVDSDTIAQIKENTPSVTSKIFKMLKEWSRQQGSEATLERLQSTMKEAPHSVTINWNVLNDLMKQSPSEISSSELTSSTPAMPVSGDLGENPSVEKQDNIDGSEDPKCFEDPNKDKGRLKKLDNDELKCLRGFCLEEVGSGGFGQVYKSKHKISGLDIHVVLKKILVRDDEDDKKQSLTNEKLSSRTMHFAIVPLLAYGADDTIQGPERAFYFISPYLEKGNLAEAIKNDTVPGSEVLTLPLRMKIMYHIASAIHFLHTPVTNFRGAILHMDIKSLNIVLDQWYNARLIDFGVARELEEGSDSANTTTQVPSSRGYLRNGQYDVYTDYYNFGVVIRELLTGRKPYDGEEELGTLTITQLVEILMPLWKYSAGDSKGKPFPVVGDLLNISEPCLVRGAINIKDIRNSILVYYLSSPDHEVLKNFMTTKLHSPWKSDGKKCDMCMRYDEVDYTILDHKEECDGEMRVCVSCMRHSYCNPIFCHTCGEEIIPNIGNGWDAVLIAGNDVKNEALAKGFSKDVEAVKKVITSKCPLVMGISEKRVLTVKPDSPGESESMMPSLTDRLDTFLSDDHEGKQNTLVLYFSGHYSKEDGFKLGNEDEFIMIEDLQKHLKRAGRCVRLVIFLDCCCAPEVNVDNFIDNQDDVILVQLNSCTEKSQSFGDETGSVFQRLFTQALTRRALSSKCINECKDCGIDGDFVTLDKLQEYIANHYKDYPTVSKLSEPISKTQKTRLKDKCIGYVVNFRVHLEFHFELKDKETKKEVPHSTFSNIEELRTILFGEYLKMKPTGQGPTLSIEYFHDILFIFSKLGPKDKHRHELDTVEKMDLAWDCRRELHVSLRDASEKTGTHLVGVFFEETSVKPVMDYLFQNGTKNAVDKNTMEYTTNFETFLKFLELEKPTLDKVLTVVNGLHKAKCELEKEQVVSSICVKFPYNENTSPKYRTDFLCFGLLVDKMKDDKIKE